LQGKIFDKQQAQPCDMLYSNKREYLFLAIRACEYYSSCLFSSRKYSHYFWILMFGLNAATRAVARSAVHHAPLLNSARQTGTSSALSLSLPVHRLPTRGIDIPAVGIIFAGLTTVSVYSKDAMELQALLPPADPHTEAMFGKLFGIATTLTGIAAYLNDLTEAEKRKVASAQGASTVTTEVVETMGDASDSLGSEDET